MPQRTLKTIMLAVAVATTFAAYVLRLDRSAGLMVDDAWYILLARAIAEGDGYRLVNSAAAPILPLYPPGFPAILSAMFAVSPHFPENVWLLKSVSIGAMLGVGALTYVYLTKYRQLAGDLSACIAWAVVLTPAFVFLATSTLMTECVFTFALLAAVVLIEKGVRDPFFLVAAGAVAASVVLIRSSGAGLVAAAAIWFLKEKRWKEASIFFAAAACCLLPWMIYARAHRPTDAEREANRGSVVYTYQDQFWMRWAGAPTSGRVTARDLPARIATNIEDVFGRDIAGIAIPSTFRGSRESGTEVISLGGKAGVASGSMGSAPATFMISLLLSCVVLVGFFKSVRERVTVAEILVPIALAIVLLWPFWSFRFVLPLAPFLLVYMVVGVKALAPSRVARIVLMTIIGLHLFDHAGYVLQLRDPSRSSTLDWLASARDVDATLEWMNRDLKDEGAVATTNPALVYLRTGRKTISFDQITSDWSVWRRKGVRYVVCLLPTELPRGDYKLLYHSAGRLWVIEI